MKIHLAIFLSLFLILLLPAAVQASPLLPWGDGELAFFGEYAGHGYQANDYGLVVGGGISFNEHIALGFESFHKDYLTEYGCFLLLYAEPYLAKLDLFSVMNMGEEHWQGNLSLMYVLEDQEDRFALGLGINLLFGLAHDGWAEVNLSYHADCGLIFYGSLQYVVYTYNDPYWPYGEYDETHFYFLKFGTGVNF